ncbi:MAG: FtsQ-type POTRA domain-containing protein [Bacilli bacterium]|nr:FtsQ-type POTRA domain-containing protein [Bacilli bacterium]
MAKKLVKKRKIKLRSLFIVLLILGGLIFGVYSYLDSSIKNIIIEGNNYLNDDYIIENADIKDYPSFYFTSTFKIKKKLLKSPYIKDVKVKRKFYHTFDIIIDENRALFINNIKKKIVFENKKEIPEDKIINIKNIPRVINYIPDNKYNKFIKKMSLINKNTLRKISDIEYKPNDLDKDRFLLYMDDGNMVYLTLTKFKSINYYNEVIAQLDNKKGILYLDNGNHFQVKG